MKKVCLMGSVRFFHVLVLLSVFSMVPLALNAQPTTNALTYSSSGTEITITGYVGPGGDIVIPEEIEGLPVRAIGDNAFMGGLITSVRFPDNLVTIREYAFADCQFLTNVQFGTSLVTIETYAFSNCQELEALLIPDSVTSIGSEAFVAVGIATGLDIPIVLGNGITNIGNSAFVDPSAKGIVFRGNMPAFGGSVFNRADPDLILYYLPGATGWASSVQGVPARVLSASALTVGREQVVENPANYGLYTAESIVDLSLGGLMIEKDGTNAVVTLQPQIATSLDPENFTDFEGPIHVSVPMTGDQGFIRVRANP